MDNAAGLGIEAGPMERMPLRDMRSLSRTTHELIPVRTMEGVPKTGSLATRKEYANEVFLCAEPGLGSRFRLVG